MKHLIYALVDPRSRSVEYVGQSSTGMKRPRQSHDHGECGPWVRELSALGLKPEIEILEHIPDPKAPGTKCWWWTGLNATALNDAERWWIAFWRAYGSARLLNVEDGGGSGPMSASTRAKIGVKSKVRMSSPEVRARMGGDNNPAKRPEVRAKISAFATGRHPTSEVRTKIGAATKTRSALPEYRARMSATTKAQMSTPEALARMSGDNNPSRRPEVRAKLSTASRAQMLRTEFLIKMCGENNFAKRPEVRAKMSIKAKIRATTPEARAKMSGDNNPAKRLEVRAKMSATKRFRSACRKIANAKIPD